MFYGPPYSCPLKSKLFEILNYSVLYAIHVNFIFSVFWTNVQSKRTTRAEPEDRLWSADHSLRNAVLHVISKRKANWIGHILRRNCLLQQVIEEKVKGEIEGRRGRRRRELLDDLKERRGYSPLKEEALDLDRIVWRSRFGRGFGPVVRRTAK
jgi:hypothetical protein